MTFTLTPWRLTLDSYRDEEGEWTPCSALLDFGLLASAALFGGLGIALLIVCLEQYL